MPLYEHVFMGRQDISSQQFDALVEQFTTVIKENGGSVEKTEHWGLKNLAYKVKKNRKAHYALMNLNAPHEAVAEMERQMSLSTDVIRFFTLKVDELDEGPSAMMKRSDRDDRRGPRRDRDDRPPRRPARTAEDAPSEKSNDKTSSADDKADSADDKANGEDKE